MIAGEISTVIGFVKHLIIVILVISVSAVAATSWERIYGSDCPGIIIATEKPECWFSPTSYDVEAPVSINQSNIKYNGTGQLVEYNAEGTGNGYAIISHVYGTVYNGSGQIFAFTEDRTYPWSGKEYHIEISNVKYNNGKVLNDYDVSVSDGKCAPFYCNMGSNQAIADCNGTINGVPTFVAGINGNAANFNGASSINYAGNIFDSPSGSVSLWFRKNSNDTSGGIMEIGNLGQPSSLGLFYNNSSNVYFEIKGSDIMEHQASASNVISQTAFTHIVIMWDKRESIYYTKLFINGKYESGNTLTKPFTHSNRPMKIGTTGFYGNSKSIIDEVRFFNWALSDSEVYAEYVYSSNKYKHQPTNKPISTGPVKIIGKTLTVNNKPFIVKGAGYQPIPIGEQPTRSTLNSVFTNKSIIARDVKCLKDMGVNTVRLWAELPNDMTLLDALQKAGIYAIMAFEIPSSDDDSAIDYSNASTIAYYKSRIKTYVNQFKAHPAVLAWAIGNENNLHYDGDMAGWYKLANELAKVAYKTEGANYHPTIVVNGYMIFSGNADYCSDDNSLNYVDIWGHNTYNRYDYHSYFCYYNKISAKPLIITEFGVDAYDKTSSSENQNLQSTWVVYEWTQIKNNSLGGCVMAYSDEWWKSGSPSSHDLGGYYTDTQPDSYSNEEWYGIMAVKDNGSQPDIMLPRKIYYSLQKTFRDVSIVPNIVGKTSADANTAIVKAGLKVGTITKKYSNTIAKDKVISQNPDANTTVLADSNVNYVLSLGKSAIVPNIGSKTAAAANTAIVNAKLVTGDITTAYSNTVVVGSVISQNPVSGTVVAVGSKVNYVISKGKSAAVPNINGLTTAKADAAIIKAGLKVGIVTPAYHNTIAAGNVIISDPVAGKVVAAGSKVNYIKSLGKSVVVPNVADLTTAKADAAIIKAGLKVGTVTTADSDTVAAGSVISQNPVSGTVVAVGSKVNYVKSLGHKILLEDLRRYDVLGAKWEYLSTYKITGDVAASGTTVGTISVGNSLKNVNGHKCNVVTASCAGTDISYSWYKDSSGIHLAGWGTVNSAGTVNLSMNSSLTVPTSLITGKEYKSSGTANGSFKFKGLTTAATFNGTASTSYKLIGTEKIVVNKVTYLANKVENSLIINGKIKFNYYGTTYSGNYSATVNQTFWGVPGVGIVKATENMPITVSVTGVGSTVLKFTETDVLTDYSPK